MNAIDNNIGRGDVIDADKMTLAVRSFFPLINRNRVSIQGTSMWPSLASGQVSDISYCITRLKPGKCYAFFFKKRLVVHRFVTMNNGMAIFMGDRSQSVETVSRHCILGEVTLHQNMFVVWMINVINVAYFRFHFSLKKLQSLRISIILLLTIGAHYA